MSQKTVAATMKALGKAIEVHKKAIASHRDALRELLDDAEAVCEASSDALESMDYAVQRLSEYV